VSRPAHAPVSAKLCVFAGVIVGAISIVGACSTEPTRDVGNSVDSGTLGDASASHAGMAGEGSASEIDGAAGTSSGGSASSDAGLDYPDVDGGGCIPGVPRCHGDFGYQQCEQDGTWGPPHSCAGYSSDGTSSYCVMTVASPGSDPWAACVDPACWYWISRGFIPGPTQVGICTSSNTIRQCNGGGTLSTETCEGVCTQVGVLDGRTLGYCGEQCSDGARECLGGAVYRECQGGRWLAEIKTCEGGQICNPVGSGAIPEVRCGGDCDPGTSRCAADGHSIETCSEDKVWEPGQTCTVGICRPAGPQAECQTECLSDQFDCAEDGASSQRSCDELRHWAESSACPEATSCRISAGQSLGCVQCVGSSTAGNEYGVSDSRCEAGGVAQCGEDNAWQTAVPCSPGETCVELHAGVSVVAYCQP
jgi:hypothetical protein